MKKFCHLALATSWFPGNSQKEREEVPRRNDTAREATHKLRLPIGGRRSARRGIIQPNSRESKRAGVPVDNLASPWVFAALILLGFAQSIMTPKTSACP